MKKEVVFSLCLTAVSAVFVVGCSTKQDVVACNARQAAVDASATEVREAEETVATEPVTTPNEAAVTVEAQPVAPIEQSQEEVGAGEKVKTAQKSQKVVHPQPVAYVVTAGDSISALAVRFNVRTPDILALNPTLRKNPNNLRIGQRVMLPPGTDISKKAKPRQAKAGNKATKGTVSNSGNTVFYTVKAGDVLGGIANRYGVKVKAIRQINHLKGDTIWVGQKLAIPNATKKPEKKAADKVKKPVVEQKGTPVKNIVSQPGTESESEKAVKAVSVDEKKDNSAAVPGEVGVEAVPPPPGEGEQQLGEDALPPVPKQQSEVKQTFHAYTVGEGEDLVSIALKFGVDPAELRAANGIDAASGNAVAAGTTLQIPIAPAP